MASASDMIELSEDELKARFISLRAKHFHNEKYGDYDIIAYILKGQPNPERLNQFVVDWGSSFEVQQEIEKLVNGAIYDKADTSSDALKARLLAIVDHPKSDMRDKREAIRLIAEMEGYIVKASEKKVQHVGPDGKPLFSKPILIKVDPNAGVEPEKPADDDEESDDYQE